MAYLFGVGTGDDARFTPAGNWFGPSIATFLAGWFFPTTLTAGRYYWGAGVSDISGVKVDTSTGELRCMTRCVTTNGEWPTTDASIALNEWAFLAFAHSGVNTPTGTPWRVWRGGLTGRPRMLTFGTQVNGSGTTSSGGTVVLGNAGTTASLALQGEIGEVSFGFQAGAGLLLPSTFGGWTAREEQLIMEKFVMPCYHGEYAMLQDLYTPSQQGEMYHCCCTIDGDVGYAAKARDVSIESRQARAFSLFSASVVTRHPPVSDRSSVAWGRRRSEV